MDKRSNIKIHKSFNTNSSIINLGKLKRVIHVVWHGRYSSGVILVAYMCLMGCQNRYRIKLSNLQSCTGHDQIKTIMFAVHMSQVLLMHMVAVFKKMHPFTPPPPHSANHSCHGLSGKLLSCVH